jgi:hypothetical protein
MIKFKLRILCQNELPEGGFLPEKPSNDGGFKGIKKTSKKLGKRIDGGWGGRVAFARRREMLRRERLSSRSR